MKLIDRALANHLELGLHPRLLAFFIELAILSIGIKIKFNFYALKKALRTKLMGFNINKEQRCIQVYILGLDVLFWIYND